MMMFASPADLTRALRTMPKEARHALVSLCGKHAQRLVCAARKRFAITTDEDRLVDLTFRWMEMFLLSRNPDEIARFQPGERGWSPFRNYLLLKAAKLLLSPAGSIHPGANPAPGSGAASPENHGRAVADPTKGVSPDGPHEVKCFCKPRGQASGDLVRQWASEATLWILLADASGQAWLGRLLVEGVSHLWMRLVRQPGFDPRTLLDRLHEELEPCMPEGLFVEAVVAQFDSSEVTLAAAGGGFMLMRNGCGEHAQRERLSGDLLGVAMPDAEPRQQEIRPFTQGCEITMTSDGFCDQPAEASRLGDTILDHLASVSDRQWMHDAVIDVLHSVLAGNRQQDDITVVSVRRR